MGATHGELLLLLPRYHRKLQQHQGQGQGQAVSKVQGLGIAMAASPSPATTPLQQGPVPKTPEGHQGGTELSQGHGSSASKPEEAGPCPVMFQLLRRRVQRGVAAQLGVEVPLRVQLSWGDSCDEVGMLPC